MTVYEEIIIEVAEMEGYDITDNDMMKYHEDKITQKIKSFQNRIKN
tara:strand:- start:49 stop:186 length:138 start_codon:yes stop_codon:yes gene_type:complete